MSNPRRMTSVLSGVTTCKQREQPISWIKCIRLANTIYVLKERDKFWWGAWTCAQMLYFSLSFVSMSIWWGTCYLYFWIWTQAKDGDTGGHFNLPSMERLSNPVTLIKSCWSLRIIALRWRQITYFIWQMTYFERYQSLRKGRIRTSRKIQASFLFHFLQSILL